MPKRKSTSSAAVQDDYDSDGGFVEDVPKSKKVKNAVAVKNGGGEKVEGRDGEVHWELTSKRRVGITEFKGKNMINIREYYEKDGEALPGKKGISLPIEQFNTLIKLLPHIETVLAEKGQSIERPDYSGASAAVDADEEDEEVEKKKGKKSKKNFEETSDEE